MVKKLLVLNNFYGSEAEVEIPAEYQSGRVLLSNYDDAELAEKVSLKPYQTLAILVKISQTFLSKCFCWGILL